MVPYSEVTWKANYEIGTDGEEYLGRFLGNGEGGGRYEYKGVDNLFYVRCLGNLEE